MDEFDVLDLLADSACQGDRGEADDIDAHSDPLPLPLPPLVQENEMEGTPDHCIAVQTVLLDDVRMLGDTRFNSTNHHEWAPFRGVGENAVEVDPSWWASLGGTVCSEIQKFVDIQLAPSEIVVPHEAEIRPHKGCNALYQAYLDTFSFARWATLKPDAKIVSLDPRDRTALEELARRQVLGGTRLQDGDLETVSDDLLQNLKQAIDDVGGRAFVKTAEKSAKNDVVLRAHTTALSVLRELTSSQDILQQSLGRGGTGQRRTARYLVVQPWIDGINKSNEFRVVIQGKRICAITQQSWGCFAGHSVESVTALIPPILQLWYERCLLTCPYSDCVLDVYVKDGIAHLIEINPNGFWGSSGSGLFHWNFDREILLDPCQLLVRIVVESLDSSTVDARKALIE